MMSHAAVGRANIADREDADAWAVHAREQTKREWNGGDGRVQARKYKGCRRWCGSLFFGGGYGLMIWNLGYLGDAYRPKSDMVVAVWVGCGVSYALFALVVFLQIKRGEIFVRSAGGAKEGKCCGIKWSALLGYLFLLAVVALFIFMPFWVGKNITECIVAGDCEQKGEDIGVATAGMFTILAVVLGLREIVKHWLNYFKPQMQCHVVRVLWMVPIYALDAMYTLYLCFVRMENDHKTGCENSSARLVAETIREFYEAYTIYAFFCYLVECLHQEAKDLELDNQDNSAQGILERMEANRAADAAPAAENLETSLLAAAPAEPTAARKSRRAPSSTKAGFVEKQGMDRPDLLYQLLRDTNPDGMKHDWKWGLGWMKPWEMGEQWLQECWKGVLQYVIFQVLFAIVVAVTRSWTFEDGSNAYGEGCLNPFTGCGQRAYPYTTLIISLSQMYALYCLVFFYHGTAKPLKRIKPLAKFISIKMIVFFSYWQGLGLSMVESNTDLLDRPAIFFGLCERDTTATDSMRCADHGGTESLSTGIQAVLICIEMFVAALGHRTVFACNEYRDRLTDEAVLGFCGAAAHSMNNKGLVDVSKDYVRHEVGAVRMVADAAGQVVERAVDAVETVEDHIVGGDRLITATSNESSNPKMDL